MSSTTSGARETEGGRLGGARADFVASLGRKVGDARELLAVLEDDIGSRPARDELRRRIHALGSGARLLRFDAMARTLQEALTALDRSSEAGAGPVGAGVREQELAFVAQVLDDLPALAWGETPARDSSRLTDEAGASALLPVTILVVGTETLADALTDNTSGAGATGGSSRSFECERTEDVTTALELARAYAPDLVVVDVDIEGAGDLVEALLDDPLTEPVPLVVLGAFTAAEESARYVALGVSKALAKPATIEALRGACDEILDARDGRTMRITLGEPTLEQLAERLVEELKRAMVDAVDKPARAYRIPLGEGTEVVGALWGAIARIQEIVTQRTGGKVRFGGDAPEGAIALAPWLHQDLPGAERMAGRGRGAGADVRLRGRRVVVADDDPGVTWFISDLLRTAGCEVHEALDGATALDMAFRIQPELVVSDILMPNLDGFALCRALRRDVALRDTPVILLSWKEDLLQRVRELGASAAAYMRKESDSRSILARVREVLRPRARIEARLRGNGEVRGRLDGLSPRLLLELVGVIRGNARVTVRDATCLFEIEIRDGAPRKATRTASDGGYRSGERALGSLLAVGAGRFVVTPSNEPVRADLTGSLFELLARPVANARGALAAIGGANTVNVQRIGLDPDTLEDYLRATPEPARTVVQKIAAGASPRQMLLAGEIAPSLLEDVLCDLAARDTLRVVEGPGGVDLLTPAVESALDVLRGGQSAAHRSASAPPPRPASAPPPANVRSTVPNAPAAKVGSRSPAAPEAPAAPPPAAPRAAAPRLERVDDYDEDPLNWPSPDSIPAPEPRGGSLPTVAEEDDDATMPSSLEDAVMRELSDRSPAPGTARPGSDPPPLIEPSALKRRSSNPPQEETADEGVLPSIPPDAVVPGAASSDEMMAAAVHGSEPLLVPSRPSGPAPDDEKAPAEGPAPRTAESFVSPLTSPLPPATAALVAPPEAPAHEETVRTAVAGSTVSPAKGSAAAKDAPTKSRSGSSAGLFMLGLALLAGAAGVVLRTVGGEPEVPTVSATESAGPMVPPAMTASAPAASTSDVPVALSETAAASASAAGDDLPPGAEVPPGFGMIEVTAPAGARVRIDGAIVGKGPTASGVAAPGYHDVRVESAGHESKSVIEVRAGKVARVESTQLP
jgi:DNA-binding response OmpR family regulator